MARRSKTGRPVHGILLLDKPLGISSNLTLQKAKRLWNANKAGHTGSLDPLATGMLPCCFGEATKFAGHLLDADKIYEVRIALGVCTTTGDAEGDVLTRQTVPHLDDAFIKYILSEFTGSQLQVPPMYSALKHEGKRLYELARQGKEIERPARAVHIRSIKLLEWTPDTLFCRVHCSKGTYIRSLAEDIGKRLGCGAHVATLRRLATGPFSAEIHSMLTPAEAERLASDVTTAELDSLLLPIDSALGHYAEIELEVQNEVALLQGQAISPSQVLTKESVIRLYSLAHRFLGLGRVLDDGRIQPQRLVVQEP